MKSRCVPIMRWILTICLVKTVQLFQTQADVLDYYQERFRYIMVDEYQDTNTVQFELVRLAGVQNTGISAW